MCYIYAYTWVCEPILVGMASFDIVVAVQKFLEQNKKNYSRGNYSYIINDRNVTKSGHESNYENKIFWSYFGVDRQHATPFSQ